MVSGYSTPQKPRYITALERCLSQNSPTNFAEEAKLILEFKIMVEMNVGEMWIDDLSLELIDSTPPSPRSKNCGVAGDLTFLLAILDKLKNILRCNVYSLTGHHSRISFTV
jgi:hypothetical protein